MLRADGTDEKKEEDGGGTENSRRAAISARKIALNTIGTCDQPRGKGTHIHTCNETLFLFPQRLLMQTDTPANEVLERSLPRELLNYDGIMGNLNDPSLPLQGHSALLGGNCQWKRWERLVEYASLIVSLKLHQ